MTQRYNLSSLFLIALMLLAAGLTPPRAQAQCPAPRFTEDVENINTDQIRANGWETFGTSISSKDRIDGDQGFQTSGANGNDPGDNRVVRSPYVTVDGDACVSFEYLSQSPGPNTFVRIGLLTRDDIFATLEEIDLSSTTTLQSYQRTFTAAEIADAAGSIDRARIAIEFNGDNAGGRRLRLDNIAISEAPVYDQGDENYSNRAPTAVDDSYTLEVNTTVPGNVLDNDSDPDIVDGIDNGPLEASIVTQPSNGTVTLNSDGSFEYTASSTGTDSFTYNVCDNGFDAECSEATVTFDVALPVELTSFTATADDRAVLLRWTTLSETGNKGFDIEQETDFGFEPVGFVEGQRTTTEETTYTFRVNNLAPGGHTFRLRQIDVDGDETISDPVTATVTLDRALTLQQTGQNPFRSQTTLEFGVNTAENVTIDLFDVLGRRVRTLYSGTPTPGRLHTVTIQAQGLAPGRYLIRARTASRQVTQPVTVVQ